MQSVRLIQVSPTSTFEGFYETEISDVYLCQTNYACSTRHARDSSEGDRVTRATEIGEGVDFIYFLFHGILTQCQHACDVLNKYHVTAVVAESFFLKKC